MKRFLLIFLVGILFVACGSKNLPLETVNKVDINKYLGNWYEIARFEHRFEKDCKNVNANYSLKEDGHIKVINRCTKITTNKKSEAIGVAYAKDDSFSKLRVSFFRPFYGEYWIIDLADDYSYALVGSPSREYLWILARDKTISSELKEKLIKKISANNFDSKKLIWTIQD